MKRGISLAYKGVAFCLLILFFSGCATTGGDPRDPFEGFNRGVYTFNETLDNVIFDPLSNVYNTVMPSPFNKGVTNFFSNLNEIAVVVNDLLQFKIDQALSDASRFVFNSTIGLFGFFDVSTHMGLPKHKEDFGLTLAHWGIGSGPFLMVPFFGPSTVRDAIGYAVDSGVLNPVFYISNTEVKAGLLTLNYVDFKADLLSARKLLGEAALDEYEFTKNAYFEKRDSMINGSTAPDFTE